MDDQVKISFDKDYKVRVYDATKFERSEELDKECTTFTEKISDFNKKVHDLVDVLETHANRIDAKKLRVTFNS